MTGKEMCAYIVEVFKKHDPTYNKSPEDIWNASPTGELYGMFDLYYAAKQLEGWKMEINTTENTEDNPLGKITWTPPELEKE